MNRHPWLLADQAAALPWDGQSWLNALCLPLLLAMSSTRYGPVGFPPVHLGRPIVLLTIVLMSTLAAACGGNPDTDQAGPAGNEAPAAATQVVDPSELVDVSTIGETDLETWARQADAWAAEALDQANTVGELLGERGAKGLILRGKARKVRSRVGTALAALGQRCATRAQTVPSAPAAYEQAERRLGQACRRFAAASKQLTNSFASGNGRPSMQGSRSSRTGSTRSARPTS